jgi:hypothetical protein
MNGALPLFAFDVGLIIGIVIVIIAVLGQVLTKLKEAQQPPPQQRRPQPQVRPPQAGAGGGAGGGKPNPLEDEIRQFLRGAAERRGPAAEKRPQQVSPPRPAQPRPAASRSPTPVEAEVVTAEAGGLREQLEAKESRRLVSSLDADMAEADDKMDSHVHEVFDHQLGTLGRTPSASGPAPAAPPSSPKGTATPLPQTAAAGLAAMFASAENIRTAVLVNEILQRPEHRWQ